MLLVLFCSTSIVEVVRIQTRLEIKEEKSAILSIIEFDKWTSMTCHRHIPTEHEDLWNMSNNVIVMGWHASAINNFSTSVSFGQLARSYGHCKSCNVYLAFLSSF